MHLVRSRPDGVRWNRIIFRSLIDSSRGPTENAMTNNEEPIRVRSEGSWSDLLPFRVAYTLGAVLIVATCWVKQSIDWLLLGIPLAIGVQLAYWNHTRRKK